MADCANDPVFILGCERSGSTWLANIFDSHADVELWMEPFADYAVLFPGFPARSEYLSDASESLRTGVRSSWQQLPLHKYPLLYRPGGSLYRKAFDRNLMSSWWRVRRALKRGATSRIDRYVLLNLNSSTVPCSRQTKKVRQPSTEVVKELRLNFKVGFLAGAFPNARYIVPIRHPGAQIASVLRLIAGGGLRELSESLPAFVRSVDTQPRFEKYREVLETCKPDADLLGTLIRWWFINYEVLLEDLERHGLRHQLVPHEEISEDPAGVARRLLADCGLELDKGVGDYLCYSTRQRGQRSSPVDTVRDSSAFYKRAIGAADPGILAGVRELAHRQDRIGKLHSELGNYLEGLEEHAPSVSAVS